MKFPGKRLLLWIWWKIRDVLKLFIAWNLRERIVHSSKANPPQYYVIRRQEPWAGFFSNVLYVCGHIAEAKKRGLVPVVDMMTTKTFYSEAGEFLGTRNAWEYFFRQPGGYSLESIKRKPKVLSGNWYPHEWVPAYDSEQPLTIKPETLSLVHNILQHDIPIKDTILLDIQDELSTMGFSGQDWIGVHFRGTDMRVAGGHPRPLGIEEYITAVKMLDPTGIKQVLLCTDEIEAIESFTAHFGERVHYSASIRGSSKEAKGIHELNRPNGKKFASGYEVLRDCIALSHCGSLICGKSNVAIAAISYNGNQYQSLTLIQE